MHLFPNGTVAITINGRDIDDYFGLETLKLVVRQPLTLTDTLGKFDVVCTVTGGGVSGQAGAIRHGISRALLQNGDEMRPILKKAGFLTRDPRMKFRYSFVSIEMTSLSEHYSAKTSLKAGRERSIISLETQ